MMCASSREAETDLASLTDSEEDCSRYRAECPAHSRNSVWPTVLEKYNGEATSSSQSAKEPVKQSTKQPVEKQKELWYARAL